MDTTASRLNVLQGEVERLTHYLMALSPDAWSHASACDQWQVADVVTHLTTMSFGFAERLSRGLQGDIAPPAGHPPSSAHNEDALRERVARGAIAERERLGDGLLATFMAGNDALHQQLTRVGPQDWETLCYHPAGPITVRDMVNIRITELAMHGWDIRAPFDANAHLAPASFPALFATIPRAVRRAFRPDVHRSRPVRYRFLITRPLATSTDIVLSREGARVEPANHAEADVTFRCDAETYVFVLFGRHTLDAAVADGAVVVEGDRDLARAFGQSFQGG